MSKELILVVDDEQNIIELSRLYLQNEGYEVAEATDGLAAIKQFEKLNPALLVLDLMLPELNGWEVCKRIRAKSEVPIIMLTARDDDVDKIVGLELGADDYMTKPYNPRELVARVKAVLRRTEATVPADEGSKPLTIGPLTIDVARHEARLAGKLLNLRTKEFDLLHTFVENEGLVLSRDQLLNQVWGFDFYGETRTVDVHVARLRERLSGEPNLNIETVWGVGYKLRNEA
ncbi:response regulator transcription factor [Anaerolineales bacterium HSG6]|nr:response regulator transcription factor [Anaerolineales bacterium HSG6]